MATTPEAKVNDVYYAMPIGTGYGSSGVPDFLCCVRGRFLAIEAKAGKGKTTALQDKNIKQIIASGGLAIVVNEDNMQELELLIKHVLRGGK